MDPGRGSSKGDTVQGRVCLRADGSTLQEGRLAKAGMRVRNGGGRGGSRLALCAPGPGDGDYLPPNL